MAVPLSRIGRALIKFFKPIRVTPPHLPGVPTSFKPFRPTIVQNEPHGEGASSDHAPSGPAITVENALSEPLDLSPPPPKAQWLELVIYLLGACRKASEKMKKKAGLASYQAVLMSKGKSKLKTLGNIVDTDAADRERA
jgi:hypothetical protein